MADDGAESQNDQHKKEQEFNRKKKQLQDSLRRKPSMEMLKAIVNGELTVLLPSMTMMVDDTITVTWLHNNAEE